MEEDFESYIDTRVNNEYPNLSKTDKWKDTNLQFDNLYNDFTNKLDTEQKKQLDEILNLRNILTGYENEFAYKLGFTDFIKSIKI